MKYYKILLRTRDVKSKAWHQLTDPLIANYQSALNKDEAAVLEIREFSGHSYRDYSEYLIDFIEAAHSGEIDISTHDPLSFEEWKESHKPAFETHLDDSSTQEILKNF